MNKVRNSFLSGFFDSFKVALTVCVLGVTMICAFFHAGANAAINAAREVTHR